ncbi:MAG: hypothetical protein QXU99_02520 [Candidatus Bathyarchaeia archaeon]
MSGKSGNKKYCGNCSSHNIYHYPDLIFCSTRYAKNKDAIVNSLWCCEEWSHTDQECYCIREALKKKRLPAQQQK